jgi:asparagine synthase (glutamine-hydrolysing)
VLQEQPPERGVATVRSEFDERTSRADQLAWMSYVSLKTDLVEDYLVRLDTMGMAHSVEGRVPLLDADLVRYALALPQATKVGGSYEQKALFRRTVSRVLPMYIVERPKQGFCPPVVDWASALLRSSTNGTSPLVEEGLVAPDAATALAERGSVNASFALWTLGTLSAWAKNVL